MNLAIRCNKCGNWQKMSTDTPKKAVFKCFQCGFRKILRSKGDWNFKLFVINENVNDPEFIKSLKKQNH
jgi:hypothetical protein